MTRHYQNKREKLSPAEREQARQMAMQKRYSYDQIGRRFGVSIGYIAKLVKGDKR